jgi:cyclohexyl-isocyanide hydratase
MIESNGIEKRREFLQVATLAGLGGLLAAQPASSAAQRPGAEPKPGTLGKAGAGPGRPRIAMLVHPDMVLQDLIGPITVFNMMRSEIHLVWKDLEPVRSETGITVAPTTVYRDCPADLDILFAPGGLAGTIAVMQDAETIEFFRHHGKTAKYVTSDCTGSLVLGAAGLLKGYRAASHWSVRDQVALFGAIPSPKRVEIDRNRITGGGVTAGIDFGLTLAGIIRGPDQAELISLILEYAPEPPFGGRPETVKPETHQKAIAIRSAAVERAREVARRIGSGGGF